MRRRSAVCLAAVAWTLLACGNADTGAARPDLEAYPGSRVIRQVASHGVIYEVAEPYPAERVLRFITERVPPQYRPRTEDFMNPGVPTSHVRGWTSYADHTTKPHTFVHHWSGEWEDPEGNILAYSLMYRSAGDQPLDRPTSTKLHVSGSHWTRAEVDAIRKDTARHRDREPARPAAAGAPAANPAYLVLRPLRTASFAGAREAAVLGQTFYFADGDAILDLSDFAFGTAEVASRGESHVVLLQTNASGKGKLRSWSSANTGRNFGIFLDSRLIAAPIVTPPLDDMIVVDGELSKEEAVQVAARLQRGGAV